MTLNIVAHDQAQFTGSPQLPRELTEQERKWVDAVKANCALRDYGHTPFGQVITADVNHSLLKYRRAGIFSLTLRLSANEAAGMIAAIDERMEHVSTVVGGRLDISCPYEPEDGDKYVFTFTKAARGLVTKGMRATQYRVGLWDGNSRKLPKWHRIPLDTSCRVSFGYNHCYHTDSPGVSLELISVQTVTCMAPTAKRKRRLSYYQRNSATCPSESHTLN